MTRALVLLGVLLMGRSLAAQTPPRFTAGLAFARVSSEVGPDSALETHSGMGTGVELRFAVPRIALQLRYLEGSLDSETGSTRHLFVYGEAMLEFAPVSWLGIQLGPHVRSTEASGGPHKWALWEARVRGEGLLHEPVVRSYVEVWRSLSASVNLAGQPKGTSHGGEVGMIVRLPSRPAWGRLGYRIERARLPSGALSETLEALIIAFGMTFR